MSISRLFTIGVSSWVFVVATSLGVRTLVGSAAISLPESLGWMFVGLAPLAIFLSVFRGAATATVAKTLYDAEHSAEMATLKARITDVSRR